MKPRSLTVTVFVLVALELSCAANKASFRKENCELEPDPGICRGWLRKWFYNSTSLRCETFYYGGCLGNDNNFDTVTECNWKCRFPILGVCAFPEARQTCRAAHRGYRFNATKKICQAYIYCNKNPNHFAIFEECDRQCGKFTESKCAYPIKPGYSCQNGSKEVVFGYNSQTRRCERFAYAGCGGYPNKFQNASECWKTCGLNSGSKCVQPGPKNRFGLVKKYYYDIQTDTCKISRYWPFSSKKNRFDTFAECEMECKGNVNYVRKAI